MLFVTGLLALLAVSNAGGNHHIKGGGHIKGHDGIQSGSVQQEVTQEAVAPSPYSFNIDTSASYGARIFREETGDAEGRVKGGIAAAVIPIKENVSPGKIQRTSQLHPAAAGHVAQIPSILPEETSDLASASGGIKSINPSGSTVGKTRFALPGPFLRDPIALPVANQPAFTAVKTVKTISASGPQRVKTVGDQPGVVVIQQKVSPVEVSSSRKGAGDILPRPLGVGGQVTGGAREVIVYDDGTIVDVGSVSGNAGASANANLQPLIGGISGGPTLQAGGQFTGGAREVIVYEDGTIEEVRGISGTSSQTAAKAEAVFSSRGSTGNVASVTSAQRTVTRTGIIPDLGTQRRPGGESGLTRSRAQAVLVSKPKVPVQIAPIPKTPAQIAPKPKVPSLSDELVKINRELIQRQNQQGFTQTFGGAVKPNSNLEEISISLSDLDLYNRVDNPIQISQPKTPVLSRDQKLKYTGSRVATGLLGSTTTSGTRGQTRGSITQSQGYNNQFIIGNAPGSVSSTRSGIQRVSVPKPKVPAKVLPNVGLSDNIKLINQQLIQRQNEEGILQTFGSVAKSESDLTGLSVSLDQLGRYGVRRPIASTQLRQPSSLAKPKLLNRGVVSVGSSNTASSVGSTRSGVQRVSVPKPKVSPQGLPNVVLSDGIKLINRQLIQRQNEEGILQTFGNVAKSESDLTGLSVSLEQFGGYGATRPISPSIQLKQPNIITKPKLTNRRVAIASGKDQTFKYTRNKVTSGILGTTGAIGSTRSGVQKVSVPKPKISTQTLPKTGINDNIKLINRQLIQRQSEEGILQTFGGVAKTESDLSGISVSLSDIDKLTKLKQAPQLRPKVSTQVLPQAGLSDDIKVINRQLIQKQTEKGFTQTFGGVVKSDADIGRVSISLDQLGDISKLGGYAVRKPEISAIRPRVSIIAGGVKPVISADQRFKYISSRPIPVAPPARSIQTVSVPKPKAPAQILPQTGLSEDIIALNRGLIQKQNEQGVLEAFGGIVNSEADLDGRFVSLGELGGLSQIYGSGVNRPQVPQLQQPITLQAPRQPTATRVDQRAQGIRITGAQRFSAARISPQNTLTTSRTSTDSQRAVTRTSSGGISRISGGSTSQISGTSLSSGSTTRQQPSSQAGFSDELVKINRQLIEKQNKEGFQQTFSGVVKNEADLDGGSIYIDELDATRLVGYNAAGEQGAQLYGYSSAGQSVTGGTASRYGGSDQRTQNAISSGRTRQTSSAASSGSRGTAGLSQTQEVGISFSPVEQSQIATGLIPAGSPGIPVSGHDKRGQLQVKIEDIPEPSSLSQVKDASDIPYIQSKVPIENFKQEDLQENIPIEIPSYVPPMRPYNYRTQIRASGSSNPIVQEQQKLEQILV